MKTWNEKVINVKLSSVLVLRIGKKQRGILTLSILFLVR